MANNKINPKDNESNQKNDNKGTTGTNEQYKAVQRNREKQRQEQIQKKKEK